MRGRSLTSVLVWLAVAATVASAQEDGPRPRAVDPPPLSDAADAATPPDGGHVAAPSPGDASDADAPGLPDDLEIRGPDGPVGLGEWFEVSVSGELSHEAQLVFADHPTDVVAGKLRRDAAGERLTVTLSLCVARAGETTITGLVLKDGVERTALPPLPVEVLSPVRDGHHPRVADLLDPVAVPLPAANAWAFFLATLAGLTLIGLFVVRAGVVKVVHVPSRPPDQVATEELGRLRLKLPTSPEEILPFIVAVSDVLRRYIEARFELHAPARTTEEFLAEAASRHDQVSERRDVLEHFLTRCDLVKFAAQRPERSETVSLLDAAESFVEETR